MYAFLPAGPPSRFHQFMMRWLLGWRVTRGTHENPEPVRTTNEV
jgi:hypothetical protein